MLLKSETQQPGFVLVRLGNPNSHAAPVQRADPYEQIDQWRYTLGLKDGRYVTFGPLTETIVTFDAAGNITSDAHADLDSAYARIGLSPLHSDPATGRTRVLWASTSIEGHLFVCLSETPANGRAQIAVIDPYTGRFIKLITANFPYGQDPALAGNPGKGKVIMPTMGTVGDRLLIADRSNGVIAVY